MLHAITPSSAVLSLPSTLKNDAIEIADHAILDVEGDISSRARNISSTLQKLYLWEKKLSEEVKVLFDLLIHPSLNESFNFGGWQSLILFVCSICK